MAVPSVDDLRGPLRGRLVVLEPLATEHEDGLLAAAEESEVFRWMPVALAGSRAAVKDWLANSLEAAEREREVPFTILDARTGAAIGSTRFLEIRLEHLRVEIGWTWMARPVWGRGHNVEAKLLLLGRAFDGAHVRRVEFKTDARNQRSRGALLALGTTYEGILRRHMVVQDGAARDSAYYSVIDVEWPKVRQHLEARLQDHLAARGGQT
ncbi:MAG: GNAT family N-acetyltransferase [Solirubrobacterales bacterium]|nr:GNAT family N-acetyltransferase [Solirubrobacterales bacterium]